jgi:hypothetical protein
MSNETFERRIVVKQIWIIATLILLLFSGSMLLAQPKGIVLTGKVISCEEHAAIEGVTIQVKGTRNISGTLFDGIYAIEIRPVDSMLVFSFEGYETMEVKIMGSRREYNVMLKSKQGSSNSAYAHTLYKGENNFYMIKESSERF